MKWTWLSTPLKLHCHWLWSMLHSVHNHSTIWLFWGFVCVGLFQIVLAVDAGILTVRALPNPTRTSKILHYSIFIFGGTILLLFTVMIGILNDQSQQEADAKSGRAAVAQIKAETTLDRVWQQVLSSQQSLETLSDLLKSSSLTTQQKDALAESKRLVNQAAHTAGTAVVSQGRSTLQPTVLPSPQSTQTPQLGSAPDMFTDAQRADFRSAASDAMTAVASLKRQDQEAQGLLTRLLGSVTKYIKEHPDSKDSDPIPEELIPQLNSVINFRPNYKNLNTDHVISAYLTYSMGNPTDTGFSIISEKFMTFKDGDSAVYGRNFPSTLGSLRLFQPTITTFSAQSLLGVMASDLTAAASQNSAPR